MMVFAHLVKDLQDFAAALFVCLLAVGGKARLMGGLKGSGIQGFEVRICRHCLKKSPM